MAASGLPLQAYMPFARALRWIGHTYHERGNAAFGWRRVHSLEQVFIVAVVPQGNYRNLEQGHLVTLA